MNSKEKKMLFQKYQLSSKFHPLTCGNDSNHEKLKLCVSGHFLYCADCNYMQELDVGYFEKLNKLLN